MENVIIQIPISKKEIAGYVSLLSLNGEININEVDVDKVFDEMAKEPIQFDDIKHYADDKDLNTFKMVLALISIGMTADKMDSKDGL